MKCILSEHAKRDTLKVVDSLELKTHKTKAFCELLNQFGVDKALFVSEDVSKSLFLATRNIPNVYCVTPSELDPVTLYQAPCVIISQKALDQVTENLV